MEQRVPFSADLGGSAKRSRVRPFNDKNDDNEEDKDKDKSEKDKDKEKGKSKESKDKDQSKGKGKEVELRAATETKRETEREPAKPLAKTASTSSSLNRPRRASLVRRAAQWLGVRPTSRSDRDNTTKRRVRPYMTSAELSDLFSRLDNDGNGELDEEEFVRIVEKIKLPVREDEAKRVFREFGSDALDMQAFICAYQKIQSARLAEAVYAPNGGGTHGEEEEFVRATRYGVDERGQRVFEVYMISRSRILKSAKKLVFRFSTSESESERERERDPRSASGGSGAFSAESLFASAAEELWEGGSLHTIHAMVREDAKSATHGAARLAWWIDIALSDVRRASVSKFIDSLGLPNNAPLLKSFDSFGSALPKDAAHRFFVGNGVTKDGLVASLSLFLQAIHLKDRPVVHHFPAWVENSFSPTTDNQGLLFLKDYYTSRFAFMCNFSMFSDTRQKEVWKSYKHAEAVAQKLREDVFDYTGDSEDEETDSDASDDDNHTTKPLHTHTLSHTHTTSTQAKSSSEEAHTILLSGGRGVPLAKKRLHRTPPSWLLSNSQLMKHKPALQIHTLSAHVMDHGGAAGPNALVTIRAMDDEKTPRVALEEKSRCGVLGRMLDGVWTKLLVVSA